MTENGSEMPAPRSPTEAAQPVEPPAEASTSSYRDADESLMPVDVGDLIDQVKNHPVIYKSDQAEFRERSEKETAWAEICSHLFKGWSEYSSQMKRERIMEVQGKWDELKEKFFDFTYPVCPIQKRRKTVFEKMSFLIHQSGDIPHRRTPTTTTIPNVAVPSSSQSYLDLKSNANFAFMLIPMLDRLSEAQLFSVIPKIIRVIERAREETKLKILQPELLTTLAGDFDPATVPPEPELAEEGPVYSSSHGRPRNEDGEIMYPETDPEDDLDDV